MPPHTNYNKLIILKILRYDIDSYPHSYPIIVIVTPIFDDYLINIILAFIYLKKRIKTIKYVSVNQLSKP